TRASAATTRSPAPTVPAASTCSRSPPGRRCRSRESRRAASLESSAMDDAAIVALQRKCQRRYYASLVGTPQTRLHQGAGGVQALITPGAPGVSFLNGVVYDDGVALVAALDELDAMYVEAGVKAWTVWAHHDDSEVGPACEARGHKLDGTP